MTREEEKKNERTALITSVALHAGLLLLFFFMVAWRPPNPPLPQVGLEINFGTADEGSGDIQPEEPVGTEGTQEEEPDQPKEEELEPEVPKPVETPVQEQVVATKEESPVVVEDKKEEVKQPVKPVVKTEPKKEEPVERKLDPNTLAQPPKTESANKTSEGKTGTEGSHGNDKNKTGDEGNPEGSLKAQDLFPGQPGGGGGTKLELDGWQWDDKPKEPNLPPGESGGRIIFEITVDEHGEITRISAFDRGLASPKAIEACKAEIEKLTFTQTGKNVPKSTTGRITFVIRSQ